MSFVSGTGAAGGSSFLEFVRTGARQRFMVLARRRRTAYHRTVTDKDVTEFDSSICTRRTSRHAAIFMFVLPSCAFNGGLGRGAARHAGYLVRRSVNPAQFRLPHLTVSGGLKPVQGGIMPRLTTSISPEQSTLTLDEARFLLAYRGMDDRRRSECLKLAEGSVAFHPRRNVPSLRLVAGGVK